MSQFKRILKADILKLSKTPFFLLHAAIPLLGIGIFWGYQRLTNYQADVLTINYFQILTLVYPILAAWLITIMVDQEIEAGDGFFLLNTSSKSRTLAAKILLLVVSGFCSCLFIGGAYHALLTQFSSDYSLPFSLILILVGVVWCSSLFLYFFHLWLGFYFGRNVNFAVAAVELLLSALLLTGLGDTIWFLFPCSWGIRLVPLVAGYFYRHTAEVLIKIQFGAGSLVLLTLAMFAFLFIWFRKWEGRKNEF